VPDLAGPPLIFHLAEEEDEFADAHPAGCGPVNMQLDPEMHPAASGVVPVLVSGPDPPLDADTDMPPAAGSLLPNTQLPALPSVNALDREEDQDEIDPEYPD